MPNAPFIRYPDTDFGDDCLHISEFVKTPLRVPVREGLTIEVDLSDKSDQSIINQVTGATLSKSGSPVKTLGSTLVGVGQGYYTADRASSMDFTMIALARTEASTRSMLISNFQRSNAGTESEVSSGDSLTYSSVDTQIYSQGNPGTSNPAGQDLGFETLPGKNAVAVAGTSNKTIVRPFYYSSADGFVIGPPGNARQDREAADTVPLLIGASYAVDLNSAPSYLSAAIVYNRVLSDSEIEQVLRYLYDEWAPLVGAA